MDRHGDTVRWPSPSHLVDGTSGEGEDRAGLRTKSERFASCLHLVIDRTVQHHLQEVFDVLVAGYHKRWKGVILYRNACPAHRNTRQRGMSMQERFDAAFADDLKARRNDVTTR